jgi:peptide chain release factor 1
MAFEKLERMYLRFKEIEELMSRPDVATNPTSLQTLGKEHASLQQPATAYADYLQIERDLADVEALLAEATDQEMRHVAREELTALERRRDEAASSLTQYMVETDPTMRRMSSSRSAPAGREEATLFAADFSACTALRPRQGWDVEVMTVRSAGEGLQGDSL